MINTERLRREGVRYLSSLIPNIHTDLLTLMVDLVVWGAISFSVTMIIVQPYGIIDNILYSGLRLPVLWNLQLLAGYPDALKTLSTWISPEQSLHWTTVITVALMIEFFMIKLPQRGFTVVHTVSYAILVAFGSLVFPFEWGYTTLTDIFHNFPATGAFQLTMYGTWNIANGKILESVIGRNGFMAFSLFFAWIVGQDAMNGRLKLHFNKKSLVLGIGILGAFVFWILLPAILPSIFSATYKGTPWFPQDIYVWYGHATWFQPNQPGYDIIKELWVPGGIGANYSSNGKDFIVDRFYFAQPSMWYGPIMRLTNIITKALCTIFIAYVFLPKGKPNKVVNLL